MTARNYDFWTTNAVLDRDDVSAEPIADIVVFYRHTFPLRHDCFEFSKVQNYIRAIKAPNRATYDFSGAILELLVDHFLFDLTNALHHCLFGGLCCDAPKIARGHFHLDGVAHFGVRLDLARFGELDFVLRIAHMINYEQIRERADFAGLRVDVDPQIP